MYNDSGTLLKHLSSPAARSLAAGSPPGSLVRKKRSIVPWLMFVDESLVTKKYQRTLAIMFGLLTVNEIKLVPPCCKY